MHDDFTLIVYLTGYHVVTVLLIFTVLALCPMGRYFKKLEKGKIKTKLTLEQTLDCMYDIQEKKCIADDIDIRNGTPAESITDFLGDYFLHAYGLQKLATEKLDNFIAGLFKFEHVNERIRWFLVTLGLRKETLYSKLVSLVDYLNRP
jgi:hypothetical protein